MISHPTLARRAARLSLLIAALLQFAGAVVVPWAHLSADDPAAVVVGREGGTAPAAPAPHDELSCVLCHTLASVPLLTGGSTLPASGEVGDGRIPGVPVGRSARFLALPSARAPPLS